MKRTKRLISMSLTAAFVLLSVGCGFSALAGNKESVNVTATPVRYTVSLNGQDYNLRAYTINGSDYYKLRDIAIILNGTKKQFQIKWDSTNNAVQITMGRPYEISGGELTATEGVKTASLSMSVIYIDGKEALNSAYYIDGNNYINLNDLAGSMDISAEIDSENRKVSIRNSKSLQTNDGYALTLVADNTEALLNGESKALATPPFIQSGIFYMPLEAITKLLGGTYFFKNDIVSIELFGNITQYRIGSRTVSINGSFYEVSGSRFDFSKAWDTVAIDDKYVPIELNGTVFVPSSFPVSPYNGINDVRPCPESRMVIIGGFKNERGVSEVKLMDSYDSLPENFKSQLKYAGVVGEVINYDIEEYKNDDLQVYVMRINEPYEDMESMDGRVCAINVVGSGYSTPRGLKIGDSENRAWLLYGYERFTGSFSYKVNDGLVASFTFYTRYYGG